MLFHSMTFVVFMAIVLPLYYRSGHRAQNVILTIASYVFYGWWDVRFLSLLWISTAVDYQVAKIMDRTEDQRKRRLLVSVSVVGNLLLLGVFKYFNFFADSFVRVLNTFGMEADPVTLNIVLPVGISFYTFQTLSYTIDVYRRDIPAAQRLSDFALYISFFPQLVAGPIERASTLLPQVQRARTIETAKVMDGLWLILVGYLKKLVIADRTSAIVAQGFGGAALPDAMSSWLYPYAFAIQIYGDFSGYSDIARGLAKIMGFELMVNFGAPYLVSNPSAFWRHWHISLSTWLRDYLYIPLGGSRDGEARTYRNLMITMVLGGLWHGAGWAYLLWGVFHGLLLALHRRFAEMTTPLERAMGTALFRAVCVFLFFQLTCLGWLLFRAGSLPPGVDQAAFIFSSVRSLLTGPLVDSANPEGTVHALRVVLACGALALLLQKYHAEMDRFHQWSWPRRVVTSTAVLAVVTVFGVFGGAEFIYFQF